MKRIFISLFAAVLAVSLSAQAPQSFKYQTVVRSADGSTVLASQTVAFRISILQGTITGTESYVETFSVATNQFGLAVSNIGEGTPVTGTFSSIDWGTGPYFMKVEIDPDNGTDFEEVGTSQLLSVPYALHAKTSDDSFSGDYKDLINAPTMVEKPDTTYLVRLMSTDEDYIDFGTFEGFTNNSDWSVIERVMMPAGTGSAGGWHFFRGKGWTDKEGDVAISISTSGLHAWVRKGLSWNSVTYDASLTEETWYNICFQYDATENLLELYLDGLLVGQLPGVTPQDDSGNTNKMFWGGQDVDPGKGQGDIYSEASIVFASQHWLQRKLTPAEISGYDGTFESEPALFFSAKINPSSVTDATGNGRDGTNGNTPEYLSEVIIQGSETNEPVFISGVSNYGEIDSDITVTGTALFMNSDGKYEKADAGSALTMPCVALALETGTGNKKILLQGYVSNDDWSWTPGGLIYVSPDDAGTLTQTIPASSGNQVQIVGYASKPNTVYFNPNLMLIEIK